jgi:AcrR family transcriptional regulator
MPRPLSTSARAKLLEAARELVAEGGPAAVTVDAVAKRSGVAKTTLYRHFENGHDLIITALRDLPASIETPDTGDLRDDLVELVCRFTQLVSVACSSRCYRTPPTIPTSPISTTSSKKNDGDPSWRCSNTLAPAAN